jgi:hypothetical protein
MTSTGPIGPIYNRRIKPVSLVRDICALSPKGTYLKHLRSDLEESGIQDAVKHHRSDILFDWIMDAFSYQGVSNTAASVFIERNGNATYDMVRGLIENTQGQCHKLTEFDQFNRCGYQKLSQKCNEPGHLHGCPVPTLQLRKGLLNQAAFSLFLYIRDTCGGDLVKHINRILVAADIPGHPDRVERMRQALCDSLLRINGVSRKVINMTFADLLAGAFVAPSRSFDVGVSMVAVDTLVHKFFERTGILDRLGGNHAFGAACYGPGGCAGIIDNIAREIDCRAYSRAYPAYFPRFVQYQIWRFCAEGGLAICNGRSIDDEDRCQNKDCPVFSQCGRMPPRGVASVLEETPQ